MVPRLSQCKTRAQANFIPNFPSSDSIYINSVVAFATALYLDSVVGCFLELHESIFLLRKMQYLDVEHLLFGQTTQFESEKATISCDG